MPIDEWDEKAREFALTLLRPQVAGYMIATDHLETADNPYWRGQAEDAKAAIKSVLDDIDTAAERRGIERAALVAEDYGNTILIARLFALRIAERIRALAPPMADAGPTEPAGASDREDERK